MGNSNGKIAELEVSRLDVEATPSCTLDKGMLQSEWRSFLGKHILPKLSSGESSSISASMRKLKRKRQWQILCKHQRSIAKRFQQDADVALKMALLEEAAALYQASCTIQEFVTKPTPASDHLHATLKMAERDLKADPQSRRRSERPAPAEPALRDLFNVFLKRTGLLLNIREKLLRLSAAQKWALCLYAECTDAAQVAQKLADDAFEASALEASTQFYRAAVRLYESDTLVAALQSAMDEAEYERFALKVKNREKQTGKNNAELDESTSDAPDEAALETAKQTFLASMRSLPNALSSILESIVPMNRMRAVQDFLAPQLDATPAPAPVPASQPQPQPEPHLESQPEPQPRPAEAPVSTSSTSGKDDDDVELDSGDIIATPDTTKEPRLSSGASNHIQKLQLQLQLRPDMFCATSRQKPKALTVARRGFRHDAPGEPREIEAPETPPNAGSAEPRHQQEELGHMALDRAVVLPKRKQISSTRLRFKPAPLDADVL